jgi:methylamine--corrinoid protein Co-methyltransferase
VLIDRKWEAIVMISFWKVMDRAYNTGPLMKVEKFDIEVFRKATILQKEFGIRFDLKTPVPEDDDLADRVFQAGLELFLGVGIYNAGSGRVIRFSREEVEEALTELSKLPTSIFIGEGPDTRELKKRKISDQIPPITLGGFIEDNPNEGRDFVQMYKSVAQEKLVDGIYYGPAPRTSEGRPYSFNTPFEIRATRQAAMWMREATRAVGRPGLHLLDASFSAMGTSVSFDEVVGLRKTDAVSIPHISELKINNDLLNRVSLTMEYGCFRNPFWTSIVGGFAGGPEGAVICSVASALNAIMVYQVAGCGYVLSSTILNNPPVTSDRRTYWVRNVSLQALARNTNLICGGGGSLAAGPGTEQQLFEIAGLASIISVAGGNIFHGARKSKLVKPNQGTGLESRWMAEVARATGSLTRAEVNDLVNFILARFEDRITPDQADPGYAFEELYDLNTVEVKPQYLEQYANVKKELESWGLRFKT